MKVLSLFANIGVAEAYLSELGVNVVLANELIESVKRKNRNIIFNSSIASKKALWLS